MRQRGFTLIEIIVAVAILALMALVVVPALGNLTRLDLRRGGHQLAANLRRAFDESALTGRTYRVTFHMPPAANAPAASKEAKDVPPIVVEASDGGMTFSGRSGALELADDANALEDPQLSSFENYFEGSGLATAPPPDTATGSAAGETLKAMFGINRLAKAGNKAQFQPEGQITLPVGIRVSAVWVNGMQESVSFGDASLLFFPAGYTQNAIVYLADTNGNTVSVALEAMTGKSEMTDGERNPDTLRGD